MKKILLFAFCFISLSHISQSRLDFIMSKGYYVQNKTDYYLENNIDIGHVISNEQLNSCINNDVFNYFDELKKYDTELKQKVFKEDNSKEYYSYLDSLQKLKDFYKNGFEYILVSYKYSKTSEMSDLSSYNIESKSFEVNKEIGSFRKDEEDYDILENVKSGKQSFKGLTFEPINDIIQRANISDFMEMYGVKVYRGHLKTEIKIHNERDALKIENNSPLEILIMFNRFDTTKDIYPVRKVLFFVDDKVIQSYGSDEKIDALLEVPIPESFKSSEAETVSSPFSGSGFGGDDLPDTGSGDYGTGGYGSRIRVSNITSKPKTPNDEMCKIALKLIIDSRGDVVEASVLRAKTTTSNQKLIDELIELVKKEVKYQEKRGARNETAYYTISINPS